MLHLIPSLGNSKIKKGSKYAETLGPRFSFQRWTFRYSSDIPVVSN
jgi:hypothetical protein